MARGKKKPHGNYLRNLPPHRVGAVKAEGAAGEGEERSVGTESHIDTTVTVIRSASMIFQPKQQFPN